ncbi:aspartate kinase [Streptomyces rubradiris]|uniref:Aspartokinase n=1 Tax=Streptomyces rubradiris TaxID=285531 RepID=A0ABQ3RR64_STRRR|nr:aspartate kinase [Streptomyces rubradiris]GHH24693.1 aspartokinase [Streptomyces rubradiris]GHI58262.1 aspartokinase [Streptomyces rubradiris]
MAAAPSTPQRPAAGPRPVRVLKFGGTSMGTTPEALARIARIVASVHRHSDVAVVVSARGDATDRLIEEAHSASATPPARELDQLMATGEARSAALLAIALDELRVPAVSLLGGQAGFTVSGRHTDGRIQDIATARLRQILARGEVAVVAGFQGVNEAGDVVTLGRGGSDTSAVALAVALGAAVCEIYTDVDGVFSADPRVVPQAHLIPVIRNSVMSEMAQSGARVLHPRSVELSGRAGVSLHVRSTFSQRQGTVVVPDQEGAETAMVESPGSVTAVTHEPGSARVTVVGVGPDAPPPGTEVLVLLAGASVPVDMMTRFADASGRHGWAFTVPAADVATVTGLLASPSRKVTVDPAVAKVSVVGAGLLSDPRVLGRALDALLAVGTEPLALTTSRSRISVMVAEADCAGAVAALHEEFLPAPGSPGAAHRPTVAVGSPA